MLFGHLWDISVLVSFTSRFCLSRLAVRLQALCQGQRHFQRRNLVVLPDFLDVLE